MTSLIFTFSLLQSVVEGHQFSQAQFARIEAMLAASDHLLDLCEA